MQENVKYDTVNNAVNMFRQQGFNINFQLINNNLLYSSGKVEYKDFEIVDIFHCERSKESMDASTVYAILSNSGLKGILVKKSPSS
jgi:Fe2+ or Zn2+ uptake regulation protein